MRDILRIRRAEVDDFETIIGMIDEAAAWLKTKGTEQWAAPWPSQIARDARVLRGLRGGSTWIAEDHGEAVATITYRPQGNQKLWTVEEQHNPAVYASRLIVNRRHAGNRVGSALIDWAGHQALQSWRARWIRIDVWTTNIALHNYYEKQGFVHIRICQFDDPRSYPSAALFQKATAEIDPHAVARFTMVNGRSSRPDRLNGMTCWPVLDPPPEDQQRRP